MKIILSAMLVMLLTAGSVLALETRPKVRPIDCNNTESLLTPETIEAIGKGSETKFEVDLVKRLRAICGNPLIDAMLAKKPAKP